MTPKQKLQILRYLLNDPIEWYKDCFKKYEIDPENSNDPDGQTYDESWAIISNMPRGNHQAILKLLSESEDE